MNYKLLLNYAIKTGEVMLKNGAETYRVESIMVKILEKSLTEIHDVFVTPTGIFATIDDATIENITIVKRVRNRNINLEKVSKAENIYNKYLKKEYLLEEAYKSILEVEKLPPYSKLVKIFAFAMTAASFTIVFNGGIKEFLYGVIIGSFGGVFYAYFEHKKLHFFLNNFLTSIIITITAEFLINESNLINDFNILIVSCIMPMVPGVAITNAMRDIIGGDLVAGMSRTLEAFLVAISIAMGVGSVLQVITLFLLK